MYVYVAAAEIVVETGRGVDHVAQHELMVYFLGTLKFLSGNPTVVKTLANKRYLGSLSEILANVNSTVRAQNRPRYLETARCRFVVLLQLNNGVVCKFVQMV